MRKLLALAVVLAAASAPLRAEVYEIDAAHSSVGFKVRHLVGRVSGRFTRFSGTIAYAPGKPESWRVEASIDASSINTDNEKRDGHLQSPDFFDAAKCPTLSFKSTGVSGVKDGAAKLAGELTMHCVTKPVVLELEIGGTTTDAKIGSKAGFSAKGKINRKDFGIVWNRALDSGGLMIGEDVEIAVEIEAAAKTKN